MPKRSQIFILTLVLAVASSMVASKEPTGKELQLAFEQLDKHLNDKGALDELGAALAAAKRAQSTSGFVESPLQRAAKYFVYLNEFESCSAKAVRYMDHMLHGRPNGEPNNQVLLPSSPFDYLPTWQAKDRLDKLVESTLIRASGKCSSFLESWFQESHRALDSNKKSLLFDFLTPELLKGGANHNLAAMLVSAVTKSDSSLAKQVATMKADELRRMFTSYLVANLVEPCKSYVKTMAAVMEAGQQFGAGKQRSRARLFDEPSEEFVDAVYRYEECKYSTGLTSRNIDRHAREAAAVVLAN